MIKLENFISNEVGLSLNNYIYNSINLFKYSTHELNDYIRNKCDENPLIYIDEEKMPLSVLAHHTKQDTPDTLSELFSYFNCTLKDDEKFVMNHVLHSLNSNGFLESHTSEIAQLTNASEELVNQLIEILKSYDNERGIGCSDTFDYLKFQLKHQDIYDEMLFGVFVTNLEDIRNRNFDFINGINVDENEFLDYVTLITESCALSPIVSDDVSFIEPDASILIEGDEFKISITDHLSEGVTFEPLEFDGVDRAFERKIQKYKQDFEEMSSILNARRVYMTDILTIIVNKQRDYLHGRSEFLNPLDQNDLADLTDLSPATISRLLANKFVSTPHGTVPIQSLLSKKCKDNFSVSYVIYLIKSLSDFDKMSDSRICGALYEFGVSISRRTVNKYKNEILHQL